MSRLVLLSVILAACSAKDPCAGDSEPDSIDELLALADCGTAPGVVADGEVIEGGEEVEELDFAGLTDVDGAFELVNFPNLRSVRAADLNFIKSKNSSAQLLIEDNPSLETLFMPRLTGLMRDDTVPATAVLKNLESLHTLDLLILSGAELVTIDNTALTTLNMPGLTRIELYLQVANNDALTGAGFSHLTWLDSLGFIDNPLLPSCDAHAVLDQVTEAMGEEPLNQIRGNQADHCGD